MRSTIDRNISPTPTNGTAGSRSPARRLLVMTVLAATAATTGAWICTLLAPNADPMTRRLLVILALAAAALVWSRKIGWSRIGAAGPSSWQNVRLLCVPAAVALVPLFWGWSPPTAGTLSVLVIGYAATGVYEELWFRGIMLREASTLGLVPAATATGVLFGLSHLVNIAFGQNVWVTASQAVGATAFGFGFAILRWRTNAIWLLVLIHAVGDLLFHTTALHGPALALVLVSHDIIVLAWGLLLMRGTTPAPLMTAPAASPTPETAPNQDPHRGTWHEATAPQWSSPSQESAILRAGR